MTVIGGIGGAVNGSAMVRNWKINYKSDVKSGGASGMHNGTIALPGNKDWSGSFDAYGVNPVLIPGSAFTFTGSIDGSIGATGSAFCDSVKLTIDQEGTAPIGYTVGFSANGALTRGAAVVADSADPEPWPSAGCIVKTKALGGAYAELAEIRSVEITFSSGNKSYASSSTALTTKRVRGRLAGQVVISAYGATLATLLDANTVQGIQAYVNATEFWEIEWCILKDISDIEVDIEGGGPLGFKYTFEWTGWADNSGTWTEGQVNTPDLTAWWPI